MRREELTEAIHDLTEGTHMAQYALEHAMALLSDQQLGELFDTVADHHDLVSGMTAILARGVDLDLSQRETELDRVTNVAGAERRLCAQAHFDGRGAHWLGPGEVCAFAKF